MFGHDSGLAEFAVSTPLSAEISFEEVTMSNKQQKVLWPILTILALSVSVLIFGHTPRGGSTTFVEASERRLSGSRVPPASDETFKPPKAAATPGQVVGPVQMVRFTVYDEGLRPAEAHVSPGWVAVYIDDRTTRNSASLVVQTELGIPLGQVVRRAGRSRGSTQMYLQAGRYRIHEASQHGSAATLIVEP